MESEGLILDQVECQVALVAASILEFLDDPESTSPRPAVEGGPLRKVEVAFGSLIKLMSGDCAARAIAECLSEMKDFLKLMLTLMKEMIASKDLYELLVLLESLHVMPSRSYRSYGCKCRDFNDLVPQNRCACYCDDPLPIMCRVPFKKSVRPWLPLPTHLQRLCPVNIPGR